MKFYRTAWILLASPPVQLYHWPGHKSTSVIAMNRATVTDDGWIVEDPRQFRLLADHAPPRPYGYFEQLRVDARDWRTLVLWLIIVVMIVISVMYRTPLFAIPGVWLLVWYLRCLVVTVRSYRCTPLRLGVVQALERRHWLPGDSSSRMPVFRMKTMSRCS